MNQKLEKLPLRSGVGIVVLNRNNKVFVAKRIDNPKNFWQMPQGGVNQNENFLEAAKRELEEETGIKSVKLIKELSGWFEYNLPKNLLGIWKGKYKGQKQKWFIMKFTGKEKKDINLNLGKQEFSDWKWIKVEDLEKLIVPFKKKNV